MGQNPSTTSGFTRRLLLSEDGSRQEDDVGELRTREPVRSAQPYVFVTHVKADRTDHEIYLPTHWFLTSKLDIETFLVDENDLAGSQVDDVLSRAAYRCTHAVVILSPKFRTRYYAVKELNTFMRRAETEKSFKIILVLWNVSDSLAGYNPALKNFEPIRNHSNLTAADFMVERLWPALLAEFDHPQKTQQQLLEYLQQYAFRVRRQSNLPDSFQPLIDQNASSEIHTLRELESGEEESVGELEVDYVSEPSKAWQMKTRKPYFFISFTGRDHVREQIATPTYWFLTTILKVDAFMDEERYSAGDGTNAEVLIKPAHRCSYALVILSPTFRKREFCVKELNTFMTRRTREPAFNLLPVLWKIKDVTGYANTLDKLAWFKGKSGQDVDSATFMVLELWPMLVGKLKMKKIPVDELEGYLFQYLMYGRGRTQISPCLERFSKKYEERLRLQEERLRLRILCGALVAMSVTTVFLEEEVTAIPVVS